MATCIFCNQNVPHKKVGISIRGFKAPRNPIDAIMSVCPNCGGLRLVSNDYLDLLKNGFPPVSDSDVSQIDWDAIFDECELPGRDEDEEKKWVDPSDLDDHPINQFYEDKFLNKPISKWPKTRRLIRFLLMDPDERKDSFGELYCPSMRILPGGEVLFREGRTRFFLFKYSGQPRVPISICPEYAANAADAGITIYDTKT